MISCIPGTAAFSGAIAIAQVRNLCGCIKIAIDFVAPESVGQCLRLTEERRLLNIEDCSKGGRRESPVNATHADKLQGELMVGRSAAAALRQLATS